ncbi:hypothetical protein C9345_24225, partial [Escherichia coli]
GKTSIFSHPVYLFLREFSLQDFRGGSRCLVSCIYLFSNKYNWLCVFRWANVRQRKPGAEAGLMR